MVMPTGEHCWKKNSGASWARTCNIWIQSLTRSPPALPRKICEVGFKHCTVHRYSIATMLHVIASCMHNLYKKYY